MLVTALGLALMTTLGARHELLCARLFMFIVGVGSGMFNSPNTAAMMGTVAPHRRGIASGARVLVQNTGAVLSIAFVMAVVTSSVPKTVLFAVFSGLANHISNHAARSVPREHAHRASGACTRFSLLGAVVAAVRPKHGTGRGRAGRGRPGALAASRNDRAA